MPRFLVTAGCEGGYESHAFDAPNLIMAITEERAIRKGFGPGVSCGIVAWKCEVGGSRPNAAEFYVFRLGTTQRYSVTVEKSANKGAEGRAERIERMRKFHDMCLGIAPKTEPEATHGDDQDEESRMPSDAEWIEESLDRWPERIRRFANRWSEGSADYRYQDRVTMGLVALSEDRGEVALTGVTLQFIEFCGDHTESQTLHYLSPIEAHSLYEHLGALLGIAEEKDKPEREITLTQFLTDLLAVMRNRPFHEAVGQVERMLARISSPPERNADDEFDWDTGDDEDDDEAEDDRPRRPSWRRVSGLFSG